jgi:transcriptional regulator with XRE-family HTH domain
MQKTLISKNYALFLEFLRKARTDVGLSQEQLAEKLGETQSFVSKCERGERRLDVIELREWCEALDIKFPSFIANLEKELSDNATRKSKKNSGAA